MPESHVLATYLQYQALRRLERRGGHRWCDDIVHEVCVRKGQRTSSCHVKSVSDLLAERVHSGVLEQLLPAAYAAAVDDQSVARQLSDLLDLPPFYGAAGLWTQSSASSITART